ncbi:hypothetical protein [Vibrio campbellii]|uniref:hypothetical protein n=1 Tax=Vibrio campbellii TaxID=680 RepID=UPI001F45CD96|nr:hypothetical protein [Vibrio campbellii]MCE7732387.1 hypothetical protein [Vibrio campbellii]
MATTMLFHCVFNQDVSVTHFMNTGIDDVAKSLPNLYVVLLCQRPGRGVKKILGGMVIRTSLNHKDKAFYKHLNHLCMVKQELSPLVAASSVSFLPAKVGLLRALFC